MYRGHAVYRDYGYRSLVQLTLDWVNAIRGEYCLPPLGELPRGTRMSPVRCPIARALSGCGDYVSVTKFVTIYHGSSHDTRIVPSVALEFLRAFDSGCIPSLVERDSELAPLPLMSLDKMYTVLLHAFGALKTTEHEESVPA